MMKPTRKDEQVKAVDHNKSDEFVHEGLRNSVVLRTLMQHFSTTELLKLSLVNKLWNYEAKSLIRDRGIAPTFKIGRSTCKEMDAFASDLRQMDVVPFTAMTIQVRKRMCLATHECVSICDYRKLVSRGALLDPCYYDVILDRMPLKRLSLLIHPGSADQNNCKAILLAKKLLQHFSELIEELSINGQNEKFIQDYNIPDLSFRRLKTLKIIGWPEQDFVCEKNFISSLVSRAPNLENLHTPGSLLPFMDEILLEGSAAIIVVPSECIDPLGAQLPAGSGLKRLRIEKMVLLTTSQNFSVEKFNNLIPALLQSCRATLNTLHFDAKCVGPLLSYGLCLPNVRELKIYTNVSRFPPCEPVARLLKAFDFTRTFPALTKVDITISNWNVFEDIQSFTEQGNAAALKEPELMLDGRANIKHLCVLDYLTYRTLPFLSQTFPNIEILSVEESYSSMFLCDQIWNHWKHLKEIQTRIQGGSYYGQGYLHVDSVLCGIYPQEVADLREKDDQFLEAVNIVPVMPSIASFNDLRTLKLTYEHLGELKGRHDLLCSKVTGFLVFARCPNLSVAIHNKFPALECVKALDHMKPYAPVFFHPCTAEIFDCEVDELEEGEPPAPVALLL